MNNNNKKLHQNIHIEKLKQTVQSGTLSEFIFYSFLEFQQQRGEWGWDSNSHQKIPSPDKKMG